MLLEMVGVIPASPSKLLLAGEETLELTAGNYLKIETPGVEVLSEIVSPGKVWEVHIHVQIKEEDVV